MGNKISFSNVSSACISSGFIAERKGSNRENLRRVLFDVGTSNDLPARGFFLFYDSVLGQNYWGL